MLVLRNLNFPLKIIYFSKPCGLVTEISKNLRWRSACLSIRPSVQAKSLLLPVQLQEVLLSYIANPQLELALVMLIVPFIVNVSGVPLWRWLVLSLSPP